MKFLPNSEEFGEQRRIYEVSNNLSDVSRLRVYNREQSSREHERMLDILISSKLTFNK